MFVDILNSFQPVHFFMDSPIWVTVVVFGIIGAFVKCFTVFMLEVDVETGEDFEDRDWGYMVADSITNLIMCFIVAIVNVIYIFSFVYVSLSTLTHKGVAAGFPAAAGLIIITLLSWVLSSLVCKLYSVIHKRFS